MIRDLKNVIGKNEEVVWEGRPDKKCSKIEAVLNPMLFVALIWGGIDVSIIIFSGMTEVPEAAGFLIPFFLIHMMPVWIYLFGIIFAIRRIRNTQYLVTNKGIYVSGGVFTYTYNMKPFAEISSVTMKQGLVDRWCKTGDVILSTSVKMNIMNVKDYEAVYRTIKDLQTDVFADTMFPNEYRPSHNPGYSTKIDKDKYKF